ncbi:MAG: hypothetical protein LBO62_01805 [Endomicrobium sp.]|jgi:uncharacterized membrane protein YukC|nr:hypothetical protein [Endomicrobium sp.]
MGYCVNCLFQGDNSFDEKGEGRIFCMVKRKWLSESDSCLDFTEYADLSKEIRCKYAMEARDKKSGASKFSEAVKQMWKAMLITMIIAFILFIAAAKYFDRYIF